MPVLPTRFLDLGLEGSNTIRLWETGGAKGQYISPSYCWGTASFIRTTIANINEHKQGINIKQLPKTFQDCIFVCRTLGVQYLWIDAVCIIQDDIDGADWKRESIRMADIYRHSLLTISATWGYDPDSGLFRQQMDAKSDQ